MILLLHFFIAIITGIVAFAIVITIHEFGHAWVSDKLGDPTARIQGRLSLNPIVHFDQIGSTLFLITYILSILNKFPFAFGWAKPVESDPFNLKNPRRDIALISFSGPFFNLTFAILLSLFLRFAVTPFSPLSFFSDFISLLIQLNISLAVFNLIPIYPLDGSKVLLGLLPENLISEVDNFLRRYGIILLIFFIFPIFRGTSLISLIITPIIRFLINLFVPGSYIV